ncbi:MAG: hypothetical protein PUI21_03815 [Collinsella sp.]|nr:hypothetical protein [Collinsella sp.]
MISNDERREVVARLREWLAIPWYKRPLRRDAMQSIGEMVGAVPGENIVERLADLIDLQTCKDTGDDWTFHCSACGCYIELEDREGEPTMWLGESPMTPRHCPNCGAMVTEKEK